MSASRLVFALGLPLLGAACGPRHALRTADGAASVGPSSAAPAPSAPIGGARVAFVADGAPISAEFPGYANKVTQRLDDRVSVFANYDASYRALGLELTRGTLVGVPALAGYVAYHVSASYAPGVRANVAAYGQNLRLSYQVDGTKGWTLFVLEAGVLRPVAQFRAQAPGVTGPDVIVDGAIPLRAAVDLMTDASPGGRVEKATFVVAPTAEQDAIEWAFLAKGHRIVASEVDAPPLDTALEEQTPPSSGALAYGRAPRIVPYANPDGSFTVGWDSEGVVHLATLDASGRLVRDARLPTEWPRFGGFTKDPSGNVYVLTAKNNVEGDLSSNLRLTKYAPDLRRLAACDLPTGRDGLDVMTPIADSNSLLVHADGKIAIHLGKLMHKGSDGLNHQSSILAVIDAASMTYEKAPSDGLVAAHSFDQRMLVDEGEPVLADLADNLPRGIVLTKRKTGRVVFTFKTRHAREATQRGGKTLAAGEWSNDNATYAELGGLAVASGGYLVLGASEASLDNSKAVGALNESRNLFVVLAARAFDKQPLATYEGKAQADYVSENVVVSSGETTRVEHFYDFYGGLHYQRNVGVVWLTAYRDPNAENAVRPKLVKVSDDSFVALWEKWDHSRYLSTYYVVLDGHGRAKTAVTDLGAAHLPRAADPLAVGGKVVWIGGEKGRRRLLTNFLEVDGR